MSKRGQLVNKARDTKNHMKGWAHRAMLRQMRAANKYSPPSILLGPEPCEQLRLIVVHPTAAHLPLGLHAGCMMAAATPQSRTLQLPAVCPAFVAM